MTKRDLDDLSRFAVEGREGDVVFRAGDPGEDLFFVRAGSIELLDTEGGDERRLLTLGPGEFFGENSVVLGTPRDATARALTPYQLLRLDLASLTQIIHECPDIAVRMLGVLSVRVHNLTKAASLRMPSRSTHKTSSPAAETHAPAHLVHELSGARFAVKPLGTTTVGRTDSSTGFVPDIDLHEIDTQRSLSRHHAEIAANEGRFFLRAEAHARNGSFINEVRVRDGEPTELHDGDIVRFGLVGTVFSRS